MRKTSKVKSDDNNSHVETDLDTHLNNSLRKSH